MKILFKFSPLPLKTSAGFFDELVYLEVQAQIFLKILMYNKVVKIFFKD